MTESALTTRVRSIQNVAGCNLSENALEALRMARSLRADADEFRVPTVKSLDDFRGFAVFRAPAGR
jgi:hypothetical protein